MDVIVSDDLLSANRVPGQLTIYANRISLMFKTGGRDVQKFGPIRFYPTDVSESRHVARDWNRE